MQAIITVSGRGLIALPAQMRKSLGIRPLIVEATPDGILLRPAVTLPVEIYVPYRLATFDAAEAEMEAVLDGRGGN